MITPEKLETFRNVGLCDVHETPWLELMDTLEALWKVAKAAEDLVEFKMEGELIVNNAIYCRLMVLDNALATLKDRKG